MDTLPGELGGRFAEAGIVLRALAGVGHARLGEGCGIHAVCAVAQQLALKQLSAEGLGTKYNKDE